MTPAEQAAEAVAGPGFMSRLWDFIAAARDGTAKEEDCPEPFACAVALAGLFIGTRIWAHTDLQGLDAAAAEAAVDELISTERGYHNRPGRAVLHLCGQPDGPGAGQGVNVSLQLRSVMEPRAAKAVSGASASFLPALTRPAPHPAPGPHMTRNPEGTDR